MDANETKSSRLFVVRESPDPAAAGSPRSGRETGFWAFNGAIPRTSR